MVSVGLETTSSALSFAMYLLAQNPDKAEKLAAEIRAHPQRNPDFTSLTEGFPYAEAVVREGALSQYKSHMQNIMLQEEACCFIVSLLVCTALQIAEQGCMPAGKS